jgi:transketolase N-terminal domain/subunit
MNASLESLIVVSDNNHQSIKGGERNIIDRSGLQHAAASLDWTR